MPTFRFSGVDERYYTDLGVHAVPGETADFDEAPDHLWDPVKPKPAKPAKPAPEPDPIDPHEGAQPSDDEQKD